MFVVVGVVAGGRNSDRTSQQRSGPIGDDGVSASSPTPSPTLTAGSTNSSLPRRPRQLSGSFNKYKDPKSTLNLISYPDGAFATALSEAELDSVKMPANSSGTPSLEIDLWQGLHVRYGHDISCRSLYARWYHGASSWRSNLQRSLWF